MSSTSKYHVFTDCDLDGAGSYHILNLLTGRKMPYTVARVNDFPVKFSGWLQNNNLEDYEMIYVLDLDISQHEETQKLLDRPNVTIIDHHKLHIESVDNYEFANTLIENETSTCKLVYKNFKGAGQLTAAQKLLVLMVDDYDTYSFNVPNSYELNIIFWNYQGDRVQKFITEFGRGFTGFTSQQKNIIHFYARKLENIKSKLAVHTATIPIKNKKYKFVAVFADSCINDIADHIIKNYKSDIGLVINVKSSKVSIRKSKTCNLDLSNFAKNLFEVGGGHEDAAGGIICEKFLLFSKLFKPQKIKSFNG